MENVKFPVFTRAFSRVRNSAEICSDRISEAVEDSPRTKEELLGHFLYLARSMQKASDFERTLTKVVSHHKRRRKSSQTETSETWKSILTSFFNGSTGKQTDRDQNRSSCQSATKQEPGEFSDFDSLLSAVILFICEHADHVKYWRTILTSDPSLCSDGIISRQCLKDVERILQ